MLGSALLFCLSLTQAPPSPLQEGIRAFSSGDLGRAERMLGEAVRLDPRSFEARFLFGATLVQLNKTREAIVQLVQAHRLRPAHPDAFKLLAAQYMAIREYGRAIALLKPAVGDDEEVYLLLVEALQSSGQTAEALKYSERAVARFPSSPRVSCWMAYQLQFAGRYDEARALLEKATRTAPDYPASYYLLADLLLKQQKLDEAVPMFRKAVAVDPHDVDARIGFSQALVGLGRLEDALVQLREAAAIAPDEARVHFQLSRLYFRMGDEAKAESEAALAVKLRPPAPPITEVPSALRTPR